jgi:hypothetical protein
MIAIVAAILEFHNVFNRLSGFFNRISAGAVREMLAPSACKRWKGGSKSFITICD